MGKPGAKVGRTTSAAPQETVVFVTGASGMVGRCIEEIILATPVDRKMGDLCATAQDCRRWVFVPS